MSDPRYRLEAPLLRHGHIAEISSRLEHGEKLTYEEMTAFVEGTIDPPLDRAMTAMAVREEVVRGNLGPGHFKVIITSPKLRAKETGEVLNEVLGTSAEIRTSDLLNEVNIPMISREAYEAAGSAEAVRELFFESFLEGRWLNESPIDVYHRAEKVLEYLRRIRTQTKAEPLFVSHWIFMKFLQVALKNQGRKLSDDQIMDVIWQDLAATKRYGVVSGPRLISTDAGVSFIEP